MRCLLGLGYLRKPGERSCREQKEELAVAVVRWFLSFLAYRQEYSFAADLPSGQHYRFEYQRKLGSKRKRTGRGSDFDICFQHTDAVCAK
jgi:hypothetical protein